MSLKGKKVLVTGSNTGIGKSIGEVYCEKGCDVAFHGRKSPKIMKDYIEGMKKKYPNQKIVFVQADLKQIKNCKQLWGDTLKELGGCDILINNAGIQRVHPIEEFPDDEFLLVIQINFLAVYFLMKEAISYWRKKQKETGKRAWGRIINISSIHGLVSSVKKVAYCGAKHGVQGMTKVVALECAPDTDITVNTVNPCWVKTNLSVKQVKAIQKKDNISYDEAEQKIVGEKQAIKKFIEPKAIGEYCAFLSSENAKMITGAFCDISGGWYAK